MPRPKGTPKTGGRRPGSKNGSISRRDADKSEYVKATVDRVLQEYGFIAFMDIRDAFDDNGRLLPILEMPESVARAMAGIEVSDLNVDGDGKGPVGTLHKIKILDKIKALDSIGKHLGMFVERFAGPDGGALQSEHTIRFIHPEKKHEG